MTFYSNIPTVLAQQDFNDKHVDMLAAARGDGVSSEPIFVGIDWAKPDRVKTIIWLIGNNELVILK